MATWKLSELILGEYIVERELGRGGMGAVFLVKSNLTGQRFAVKKALLQDEDSRKQFLAELQTWIDLPEHPHIVACRFFRTIDDEIAIFADYLEGGSLADWIRRGKLKSVETILDVAIQFAWGLHAIHEHGLVHQDVKPGNVLMTADGIAKITDFGLARAYQRASHKRSFSPPPLPGQQSFLVSSGGMTPAYCSPEQALKQPVTRKTDIWSWGVSVLDMFVGGPSCACGGYMAAEVLEHFLESEQTPDMPFRMPNAMADVLKKCFESNPEARWATLAPATEQLIRWFEAKTRMKYRQPQHDATHRPSVTKQSPMERCTPSDAEWANPREWLERVLKAEGRNRAEADKIIAKHAATRRGQLVADIAAYDDVRIRYERLVASGQRHLMPELAALCVEAASVHRTANDKSGALALYDRAIDIGEFLIDQKWSAIHASNLATSCLNKANLMEDLGDVKSAVVCCNRAIEIRERLVSASNDFMLLNDLSIAYLTKAGKIKSMGQVQQTLEIYDRVIQIRENLVKVLGKREYARGLAVVYINKANTLMILQRPKDALPLFDLAISLLEFLNVNGPKEDLIHVLAKAYHGKGEAIVVEGETQEAFMLFDQAIQALEQLVKMRGRKELADELAPIYFSKAELLMKGADYKTSLALFDRIIQIYERLINVDGRSELAGQLAMACSKKASALVQLGDHKGAVQMYDRVIEVHEHLIQSQDRNRQAEYLAAAYQNKATSLDFLGEHKAAIALYDQAIHLLSDSIQSHGINDSIADLSLIFMNKGEAANSLHDVKTAAEAFDKAIEMMRAVVRNGKRPKDGWNFYIYRLALACTKRAKIAQDACDAQKAEQLLSLAISFWHGLVFNEGINALATNLADSLVQKAFLVSAQGDHRAAVENYDKAIAAWNILSGADKTRVRNPLAVVYLNRGCELENLGSRSLARKSYEEAIKIWEEMVSLDGRTDVSKFLSKARTCLEECIRAQ